MVNQVLLLGRITNIKIQDTEENTKYIIVALSIRRPLKNSEGIYDNDFVNVKIIGKMTEQCIHYIGEGDLIAIKGRLSTTKDDNLEIIAEKLTLLSSKKVRW